eukprot:c23668_g1_i1 orf=682-1494(+)
MTVMETKMIDRGGGKGWNLCRRLWGEQVNVQSHRTLHMGASSSEESPRDHLHDHDHHHPHRHHHHLHHHHQYLHEIGDNLFFKTFTKALLHRRRLSFEPNKKLFFPYEPGKQATSAVRIKNVCHSHIAFKFQTTAPKSCFMRPPCGVLSPGESIVATVIKHIHRPQRARTNQARDKFKIVSLKMVEGVEFTPELFDEQKDHVAVEQILRVHFLDPEHPTSELEKLKMRIAEADAANEACKKSMEEKAPARVVGQGNILEEWNKMKLARHG